MLRCCPVQIRQIHSSLARAMMVRGATEAAAQAKYIYAELGAPKLSNKERELRKQVCWFVGLPLLDSATACGALCVQAQARALQVAQQGALSSKATPACRITIRSASARARSGR